MVKMENASETTGVRVEKLGPLFLFLGLIAGCGSGQTSADTPDAPKGQNRCGDPQTRCASLDDDEPPKGDFATPPKK